MHPLETMYFATMAFALFVLVPALLICLAVPYAMLRYRDGRDGAPDPQLGFKVAMHYFFSVSVLLLLAGLTVFVVDLLLQTGSSRFDDPRFGGPPVRESFPTEGQRISFGMTLSGALFALVYFLCIVTMTTQPFSSPVRRTLLGCRFAVHALVVMVAVTAMMIGLLQRPGYGTDELRRFTIGVLIVWSPSWVVHLVLLRFRMPGEARRPQEWHPEPAALPESPQRDADAPREWDR